MQGEIYTVAPYGNIGPQEFDYEKMMAEQPEALAKEPLSPVLDSQFETMVPSGRPLTGKILPTERAAIK